MNTFNATALENMLNTCIDVSGYRGAIIFDTRDTLTDFIKEFVSLNKEVGIPGVRIIKQHFTSGVIEFANDSTISLVLLKSTNNKARRYNQILYYGQPSPEVDDLLTRCLVTYTTEQWIENDKNQTTGFINKLVIDPTEQETDTDELDKFLNEFTIQTKDIKL